ncbi:hypothetical protein CYMTET_48428 [Cymbomonas tetramitiformis]|uniref:Helicase-associated domain-containing protein n=1 Tax=Cymbomonas tetramitiformis TaxID=36881 RepID=A0AAE0BTI9_9CHLO|nr:hypothetical protein CYMTET_48428 [Cymbomonas tetramitiformis]
MFKELEAYYGRWGHCNAGMNTPTGRWVRVQRRLNREGKLPEAQVAKLEALDFDFADYVVSEDPEEFDTMFGLLLAYGNTHPNLQVPKKYDAEPYLGFWVAEQRNLKLKEENAELSELASWMKAQRLARSKGLLSVKRIAKLDDLDFDWDL